MFFFAFPSRLRAFAVAVFFTCILAMTGCQSVTVHESLVPRAGGNEPLEQLDYWHALAAKSLISNDEAFHGLLLYVDGKDDASSYADRVNSLRSRGYLPHDFNQPQDAALERGTLAVALAKYLDLRGGLTMRLLKDSPRYAQRELEYRGVYPHGGTAQLFTGAEFVGVIGKAEDFRTGDPTDLPASATPGRVPAQREVDEAPPRVSSAFNDLTDHVHPIFAMIAPDPSTLSLNPATAPASTQSAPLKLIITAVEGLASVREDETQPWQPARVGMELGEASEIRTGPRGTVQFKIPPDQVGAVDRLTTSKVLTLVQKGGKVTTDIGIKYGRTRYDLEGGGLEHQSTLRSPNATLAVRGTRVSLFDQRPFPPRAVSLTGRAQFAANRRKPLFFGNKGQGKTIVEPSSNTAGDVALAQTIVDPNLPGARTEAEQPLLATVISRGATLTIDRSTGIKIVRGGVPPTDAQLAAVLPGRLNFILRWNSDANLDLGVSTPATAKNPGGEFIYPAAGLNIAPSGGTTAFDHRGGPHGGIEVIYFNKFSDGIFALAGPDLTAGTTTTATLEAFLNGKPIDVFDGKAVTKQVTQTVTPTLPALALVAVNTPLPFVTAQAKTASPTPRRVPAQREVDAAPPRALSKAFVGPLPAAPKK